VSWRVIIRPNAVADLQDARSWYESQRTGLGDELLVEVRKAVRLLEEQPELRPVYYNGSAVDHAPVSLQDFLSCRRRLRDCLQDFARETGTSSATLNQPRDRSSIADAKRSRKNSSRICKPASGGK